jgi:hypothetical protein
MFNTEEYWARRKENKRGQGEYAKPVLIEGSGKAPLYKIGETEVHVSRKERRKFMRTLRTNILKGRVDINKLTKERLDRDRAEQGPGV